MKLRNSSGRHIFLPCQGRARSIGCPYPRGHAVRCENRGKSMLISKLNACFYPCFPAVLNCYEVTDIKKCNICDTSWDVSLVLYGYEMLKFYHKQKHLTSLMPDRFALRRFAVLVSSSKEKEKWYEQQDRIE